MEYFLQYLDDLDDLYSVVGLVWEKFRRALLKLISSVMVVAVAVAGISLYGRDQSLTNGLGRVVHEIIA